MQHLEEFQAIADANDGTRAGGSPGYDASADYVADKLTDAGYAVRKQDFLYDRFRQVGPSVLDVTPDGASEPYVDGEDFVVMEYSGSGEATAPIAPVDLVLPSGAADNTSTSGCESADFEGFPAGAIALMQRGTCTFRLKADNAEAAGASAAIIFNEGQTGRTDLLSGTLSPPQVGIPAVGATFAAGDEIAGLLATGEVTGHVVTDVTVDEDVPTVNVLADTTTGRADRTVVVGGHLDSVLEGPGINDNGSGTGAILETALQMAELGIEPRNRVRFAFWGAEESGLIGSDFYVGTLPKAERKDIALYLNFDMVGSPNFVRFVYDGDGSAFGIRGPSGSAHIEDTFTDFFGSQGLESAPTAFDGRSDYQAFINVGIPAGGLFTGAEGIKTEEQAEVYGGTAGIAYDPCYHQACDTIDNVSLDAVDQMSDAIAHTALTYAMSKSGVNGTKSSDGGGAGAADFAGSHARR
ncbi:MAG: M20/M25/M40 family metallo-hydrolase [Propionibacteriales bacterium]|nr:M20/M25/M40 family metallo-hydrolase [Propionibacteriales bacterium]